MPFFPHCLRRSHPQLRKNLRVWEPVLYKRSGMPYNTIMQETLTRTYRKFADPPKSPTCVVYDMDDTLAFYDKERRLPACADFRKNTEILDSALGHQAEGRDIVIATARPCWCHEGTVAWLQKHGLQARAMYFRRRTLQFGYPAHDLKRAMLEDVLNHQEVAGFYDDSPWNCRIAKDLGIPTFYVAGNEEYWLAKGARENWNLDIAEFVAC